MASNQYLTDQFPTHPNREFFCRLTGELNRPIREIFAVIRESRCRPLFGSCLADKSYRPDRSRTLAEKANRDAASWPRARDRLRRTSSTEAMPQIARRALGETLRMSRPTRKLQGHSSTALSVFGPLEPPAQPALAFANRGYGAIRQHFPSKPGPPMKRSLFSTQSCGITPGPTPSPAAAKG